MKTIEKTPCSACTTGRNYCPLCVVREEERERIAEKLREAYMGGCEGEDTYIALAARIAMFINHLKK